jgi:hypothetical protein
MRQTFTCLLSTIFFFSCTHSSRHDDQAKISHEIVDTIKSVASLSVAKPEIFETAFINGTTQQVNKSTLNFYGVRAGNIKIISGHIIACDPTLIEEYGKPLTQLFPTGEFPVQLSIAKLGEDESIAYARILFSDEPVAKWELAVLKSQSSGKKADKEANGYVVDGGIGCFIDEEANKALDKNKVVNLDADLLKEMDKHYHHTWRYSLFKFGNNNMAAFSTGFGDGHYRTYVGVNHNGHPCRLVTDFAFIEWK